MIKPKVEGDQSSLYRSPQAFQHRLYPQGSSTFTYGKVWSAELYIVCVLEKGGTLIIESLRRSVFRT